MRTDLQKERRNELYRLRMKDPREREKMNLKKREIYAKWIKKPGNSEIARTRSRKSVRMWRQRHPIINKIRKRSDYWKHVEKRRQASSAWGSGNREKTRHYGRRARWKKTYGPLGLVLLEMHYATKAMKALIRKREGK